MANLSRWSGDLLAEMRRRKDKDASSSSAAPATPSAPPDATPAQPATFARLDKEAETQDKKEFDWNSPEEVLAEMFFSVKGACSSGRDDVEICSDQHEREIS